MKPAFYFYNPEITIEAIRNKTQISVISSQPEQLILVLGTAEAYANLRPDGALYFLTFYSAEAAKDIFEELDRSFDIKFVDEELLILYSQGSEYGFDYFLDAARNKYFL